MSQRSSGVLLHITSLPGPFGIGDFGPAAYRFVDLLAATGTRFWQMLPLNPLGYGASPYASPSSHAGNELLVSPELLVEDGLVEDPGPIGQTGRVDYGSVSEQKRALISEIASLSPPRVVDGLSEFKERESAWLGPYSLFMAIKNAQGGAPWVLWPEELRQLEDGALASASHRLAEQIHVIEVGQYLFDDQLTRFRRYAKDQGVQLIGDIPIYVATDSVEVWNRPDLFSIDPESFELTEVAGVPPDPLSPIGQEWGMPTYRWDRHATEGFAWWIDRLRAAFRRCDVLRIDHFTGFYRYYAVPADSRDPLAGIWKEGPGMAFFDRVRSEVGHLPMIAEDLGPIMEEVDRFRRVVGLPGIRVLLEAFDEQADSARLPENYPEDCFVYTGTHDYDTATGRLASADARYRARALAYTDGPPKTFATDLIARAWASPQEVAVAPVQDLLGLGSEARMNTPGTVESNWEWRLEHEKQYDRMADLLMEMNTRFGRSTLGRGQP